MIENKEIDHGKAFDWGLASKDYAKFRDIYPQSFYDKITGLGLCLQNQEVLDLGTGTGVLPRNLYAYGAHFTGADISENQIAEARRLSAESGMDIRYLVSAAEDLDFPENSFDTVTACQCFQYFDKSVIFRKLHRLLKDNGHFCILFMAWLPEESALAKASEELVLTYNPAWTGGGMRRYAPAMPPEGEPFFEAEHVVTFDLPVSFTRETWHGRMKACRGIGASALSPEEIARFEEAHKAYLETVPPAFEIPHFATILNLRKRGR